MTDKTKPLVLKDFFPYRLYTLANHISMSLAKHYESQFGISRVQWRLIAVLGEHELLSASQICQHTAMDKVSVSRAVNGLLESKLIQRNFSQDDRRRSQISLTKKGMNTYHEIVPIALAYEKKITQRLSKHEIQNLNHLLCKLEEVEFESF